jgi:hypothetical protein
MNSFSVTVSGTIDNTNGDKVVEARDCPNGSTSGIVLGSAPIGGIGSFSGTINDAQNRTLDFIRVN